jgi:hypothetical protein
MGWEAKQKGARCRPCQVERVGSGFQDRRVLSVSSDWGRKSGQRLGRKRDLDSRHDGDDVVFGGTNTSFRQERAMVLGRDVFVGNVVLVEEGSEVGRGFVI